MLERILIITCLTVHILGLMFIADQTLRVVHIAQEITVLIQKAHP